MKCSYTIHEYTRISSRNTAMPESNILENRLFMVYINVAGAFISPMSITTYLYRPYLMRKAIFGISSSEIWHCQYPLQRSIDVKYFSLPI